jgi:glycosyltransferase involved in cell wall biosynthesis
VGAIWWKERGVAVTSTITAAPEGSPELSAEPAPAAETARPRVVVVMPAYNAARTLQRTLDDLPRDSIADIILVDDGSRDDTVALAQTLGLKTYVHRRNFGYGANQKTCYTEALRSGAEIVVMLHPDYQYDPRLLPELIRPIQTGEADVVFGSRLRGSSAVKQGMPWWKYVGNRALTWLENRTFGLSLSEFHTGYRAYSAHTLQKVNYAANGDRFIFDQQIVAQFVECGARIAEIAVPVRYFPEASSASLVDSTKYGLSILQLLLRYWLHRTGVMPSMQFTCFADRYHPAA